VELIIGMDGFNYAPDIGFHLLSSSKEFGLDVLPPCQPRININCGFNNVFLPRGSYIMHGRYLLDPQPLKEQVDEVLRNSRNIPGSKVQRFFLVTAISVSSFSMYRGHLISAFIKTSYQDYGSIDPHLRLPLPILA